MQFGLILYFSPQTATILKNYIIANTIQKSAETLRLAQGIGVQRTLEARQSLLDQVLSVRAEISYLVSDLELDFAPKALPICGTKCLSLSTHLTHP